MVVKRHRIPPGRKKGGRKLRTCLAWPGRGAPPGALGRASAEFRSWAGLAVRGGCAPAGTRRAALSLCCL